MEVVKYFMETPGINKSKCGIRKMPHEPHYAMLAHARNTRYTGHAMLIAILRATTYVGPACDVNFRRRDGVSGFRASYNAETPRVHQNPTMPE